MKIEVARDKFLSNYEVYAHTIQTQKDQEWTFTISVSTDQKKKQKRKFNPQLLDLEIITRDLSHYLSKMHQSIDTPVESMVNLMLGLNMYQLEKVEKLQIVNILPRSLVTLYAIIEECDQRFTEEQCEELLGLVEENFPISDADAVDEDIIDGAGMLAESVQTNVVPVNDDDDEDVFEVDDQLEHESLIKAKPEDKEIDE